MDKIVRIEKIQEIITLEKKNESSHNIEIPWKDELKLMEVHKIPLKYLIYNKYNGRILSRTKSLEKQNAILNPETPSDRETIKALLWDSNPERNEKTLKNILTFGQQKPGIITKDGIIIDGNRRAMLLERALETPPEKYNYFKAVVLPVTMEENPIEIERLETFFQMGEDEKLDYNATEKYIKSKELYLKISSCSEIDPEQFDEKTIKKISSWMNRPDTEIKKYLGTMVLMDEYLDYLDYNGIYTQLDKREDLFLNLKKWLDSFYGEESKRAFDGYNDVDVDDLKEIAFDYIRIKHEGKDFRIIADGNRDNHFFGNEKIWKSFKERHFAIKESLPEEKDIDYNSKNLEFHLNDRDNLFYKSANNADKSNNFDENIKEHKYQLEYKKTENEPKKLIRRAEQIFDTITPNHEALATGEVQDLVEELGNKVFDVLKKSPIKRLNLIIKLLEEINTEAKDIPENEIESIQEKIEKYSLLFIK